MQEVIVENKTLRGMSTRTTNQNEMNPETAKLGSLWQKFDKEVAVDYQHGERVYGVYYDYESDANGEFSVLAGFDGKTGPQGDKLETITIPAGKYLRFDAVANEDNEQARIEAVIKTWGKIWDYFASETDIQRAYKTDFEYYKSPTEIEIYISIAK